MEKTGILSRIDQLIMRLSTREKWMLGGGSLLGLSLLIFFLLVEPTLNRIVRLEKLIPRKEQALRELQQMESEYQAVSKKVQALTSQLPNESTFSPLSFLEENAAKNHIKDKIAFIRPLTPQEHQSLYREIPVEVKVKKVTLSQIIPFLIALEKGPHHLRIKRLSIKTQFSNPDLIDVTFLVLSYEKVAS